MTDQPQTTAAIPQVSLEPGWLQRDIDRAAARLREWRGLCVFNPAPDAAPSREPVGGYVIIKEQW